MEPRKYYSDRIGKGKLVDLPMLRSMFYYVYDRFRDEGCFDELFGRECIDNNFVWSVGVAGRDKEAFFAFQLRRTQLYPIEEKYQEYSQEDVFDVVELLYDNVSKRTDEDKRHTWCMCGGCAPTYDKGVGRRDFRQQINSFLADYGGGYELTETGEIVSRVESGMDILVKAPLPSFDPNNVELHVDAAISKFRSRHSSLNDRRDAVASLVKVIEYLRSELRNVIMNKDDDDLFNIANNYGIRHHNAKQKTEYDQKIWLDWMFCFYLSTIHAGIRLLKRYRPET